MNMRKKAGFVMGLTVALSSISMVYAQETSETQEITLSLVTEYGDDIQILGSPESTDVLQVYDGSDGTYLMKIDGTALTEAKYTDEMVGRFGYIAAKENSEDINTVGLLDEDGNEVVPFQYGTFNILSTKWAMGIIYEDGTKDDYDEIIWDENNSSYVKIKQTDVYYLPDKKCVANLERDAYNASDIYDVADAYGDRIAICDREKYTADIYDSEFNAIATGVDLFSYEEDYFSSYTIFNDEKNSKKGIKDSDGKVVLKPMKYSSLKLGYVYGYYLAKNTDGYTLVKADGTVVCPLECDNYKTYPIDSADSDEKRSYVAYGYVAFTDSNKLFKYADESGTVTGDFSYTESSLTNYGVSALVEDYTTKTSTLLSADGVETVLDGYESVDSVVNSKGMYYLVSQTDEYNNTVYGLIDWHGEVVIPCVYGTLEVTGDGKYAVVSEYSSYGPYSLYELTYPEDDTETVEEATTDSTEAAQVESETETQEAQDASESESTQEELSE